MPRPVPTGMLHLAPMSLADVVFVTPAGRSMAAPRHPASYRRGGRLSLPWRRAGCRYRASVRHCGGIRLDNPQHRLQPALPLLPQRHRSGPYYRGTHLIEQALFVAPQRAFQHEVIRGVIAAENGVVEFERFQ